MSHYEEWAEDCLPDALAHKLEAHGYDSFGCYRDKTAGQLLAFLTDKELRRLRKAWLDRDVQRFPFLRADDYHVASYI